MPVFALITHISCCLNWLIVYLMGNLVPKSCNWQLWVFWRVLVASSRTSYCYRSLLQQVGAFLVTFYCTAPKKQLYTCEQAYNLVFLRAQQKFDLLELCQSQKRAQFVPECPKHCRWVPPSIFSVDSVKYWSSAVTTAVCDCCRLCTEGALRQRKPTLKMHNLSGWEPISPDSLALCLEHSASDFVKYFLRNHRGRNFSAILLKTGREGAKTTLSKDAIPASSSSTHTEEHFQVWEQGSHHPAGFSWRFSHAIRRNFVVSLSYSKHTHTHIKYVNNWKLKKHISLDLQLQFSLKSYAIKL